MDDTPARDTGLAILKWLVIGLTATMLLSMVVLVWLFYTRLPRPVAALPDAIALPQGTGVEAVTLGRGFVLVVTDAGEALVFDATGSVLRRRIELAP